MERVDGIVMRNDVEVTFDHRHGMAMLLTNLKTHTDAFSVQLPELKLAVSMNVSAGPAASNATADAPPQPERAADAPPRAGHVERGGDLQVHDLQVGTSATVTQEHVTVEDGSGDVKLSLWLEVDVRCPNLMCAPGVLQFLADDPFTWCATATGSLNSFWDHVRCPLPHLHSDTVLIRARRRWGVREGRIPGKRRTRSKPRRRGSYSITIMITTTRGGTITAPGTTTRTTGTPTGDGSGKWVLAEQCSGS